MRRGWAAFAAVAAVGVLVLTGCSKDDPAPATWVVGDSLTVGAEMGGLGDDGTIVVDAQEAGGVAARISRILAFGVTARIELDGLNGATGQLFEVEITRDEVQRLGLEEGQAVRLVPSRLRVFERNAAASGASQAPNWVI